MNKKQIGITLGVMCLILTMAIAIQVRTMNNANSTASQTLADNELRDSVLKWKEKYDNVSNKLKKAEKKLEQVRQQATQNDTTSIEKENELKKNNTLLGITNVKGEGIIIEMQDGTKDDSILSIDTANRKLIHYEDLLSLVNELRNAGAEAIEINGQRIINTSAITCEGTVIKINGEKIGSPFTIKAIGPQALLYGQITRIGSYLDSMIEDGIIVNDVKKSENITISKYSGTMNFKYIKEKSGK